MSEYTGRDGWHTGRPVREIGDEYVRREFVRHARGLLGDLDRMRLNVTNIQLQDDDQAKVYEGHKKPQVDETNPSWYSELYWSPDNTFDRVGRHHRGRGKNGAKMGELGNPTRPNMARKQAESTDSKIVRWRVKKSLEEIVGGIDIPLKISSRLATRVKIVNGRREKVKVSTPYFHGNYVTILRDLIADRLLFGYLPECAEGRTDWESPGDDQVRAYFGMVSYEEEQRQNRRDNGVDEKNENEESKSINDLTREPGEDELESENQKPEILDKDFQDDIPF